jgi:exodeoxyribonuclease VII large subunit
MADLDASLSSNVPEYSVGELSAALKRTVEEAYGFVRVRGEVSKWFVARSGHAYLTLKDGNNVLEGVCWKGKVAGLAIKPEEGLEIVAGGRLTTFPGRSQYQLVVEEVQAHGIGALLAQLEERKKRLAEEGLFAAERRRPLPFLPEVVGVVTSPTGAVIRDILHRLKDRFPRPVLVWPVTVQGERCGPEVAHAIAGFAALPASGWPRRPDVLVVARGGGSIEDLWGFNDEAVVRAAAASPIPLVSAVGHETDTTLIDLAADVRAPTPTAAAELIVPVAAEIGTRLARDGERLASAFQRRFNDAVQAVDVAGERLPRVTGRLVEERAARLRTAAYRLRTPAEQIRARATALATAARELERGYARRLERATNRLVGAGERLAPAGARRLERAGARLEALGARLESLSYQRTLARGYALVRDRDDRVVPTKAAAAAAAALALEFADGRLDVARANGDTGPRRRRSASQDDAAPSQGSLL